MAGNTIVRSDHLRCENRRRVLQALRTNGPCSPSDIANHTGLSAASISSLCGELSDHGILNSARLKTGRTTSSRGRPQNSIQMNADAAHIITLQLSSNMILVRLVDYNANVLWETGDELDLRQLDERQLLDALASLVKRASTQDDVAKVKHIGVSFQGITEHHTGKLVWSPIIEHVNVDLPAHLRSISKLPVTINSDSRLVSEALRREHATTLGYSFVTLVFSHGVGLGLYLDGQPFSGVHTSALELGHLRFKRDGALCRCNRRGCIEAYAADYGIVRMAGDQSLHEVRPGRVKTSEMQALVDAASNGHTPAIQAYAIAGAAIGEGLVTLFTLLDPMPIAIVGRDQQSFDLMHPGMASAFRDAGFEGMQIKDFTHLFEDAEALLQAGLINNTLDLLDAEFALDTKQATSAKPII